MISRELILQALEMLSQELEKRGIFGEINLLGGTAMIIAFDARASTKDVDAIFEPSADVRQAARAVSEKLNLEFDWLNDAAKGLLSPVGDFYSLESLEFPYLRVQAPSAEYMLAMKVLAARAGIGDQRGDASDIAFLVRRLGLKTADEVMAIVSRYYDPSRILPRSLYFVEEILEELES